MPRPRTKNKTLPHRVYLQHGAYRYRPFEPMIDPADGKRKTWIKLCSVADGESAMYKALATLKDDPALDSESMPHLCQEFRIHRLDRYGNDTKAQYKAFLNVISKAFSDFSARQVTTKDCADFLRNFKDTPNTAQKYSALLDKLFVYAISELGIIQHNPIRNLDRSSYRTQRRTILATHEQIKSIRLAAMTGKDGRKTHSGDMFACIIDMSYLCWQRAIDIRLLKESQIDGNYIRFTPSKTARTSGKSVAIHITPDISAVIERARSIKRKYGTVSGYLFSKSDGKPYTKSGLSTMWKRAKQRSGITADVVFKDIRALGATDAAKAGEDRADIQKRLAHTSAKTTEIYIKEVIPDKSDLASKLPWA